MNQIVGTVSPCHHTAVGCCTRETSTGWASLLFKNEEQPSVRLLSWHPNLWHVLLFSNCLPICQLKAMQFLYLLRAVLLKTANLLYNQLQQIFALILPPEVMFHIPGDSLSWQGPQSVGQPKTPAFIVWVVQVLAESTCHTTLMNIIFSCTKDLNMIWFTISFWCQQHVWIRCTFH